MDTLVVGTRNEGKIRELHEMFSDFSVEVRGLDSFPSSPEVIEDCGTLPGNAIKKAETFAEHTHLPTVSDDSGLEVQFLNGKPGVKTARFAGENASTDENIDLLLEKMEEVDNRRAQFRTVLAYVDPNGFVHTFHGTVQGTITKIRRGSKGFGYDPVFCPKGYDKTFSEMNGDLKNEISYRRRALEKFHSFLSKKMTIFLIGNDHTAEHFKIEGEVPNRVLIQTDEDYYSIFQHSGKVVNGSYEFRFIRTQKGKLNTTGYFATETEPSPDWGGMYR